MTKKDFHNNIEFLRFLFAVMIVYAHILWFCCPVYKIYNDFPLYRKMFLDASTSFLAVEYFFIISGFFLFNHLKNKCDTTSSFAIEKIIRLWPLLTLSIMLIWGLSLFDFTEFYSYGNSLNLFFLFRTGIYNGPVNNMHSWYVCILFWSLLFYHYSYRNFNIKSVNFAFAIITFTCFSVILNRTNAVGIIPGGHMQVIGGISGAMYRGMATIGLGYFIAMFWDKKKDKLINFKTNSNAFYTLISILEIYLFLFIINNSLFHKISFKNDFIFVLAFSLLFLFFLAKRGFLSNLLENKFSKKLGELSYSIYIMQAVGFVIAKFYLWDNKDFVYENPYLNIIYTMAICLFIAVLSHFFIEKKINFYIKKYR